MSSCIRKVCLSTYSTECGTCTALTAPAIAPLTLHSHITHHVLALAYTPMRTDKQTDIPIHPYIQQIRTCIDIHIHIINTPTRTDTDRIPPVLNSLRNRYVIDGRILVYYNQ
ncbi:hypothetical protein LOAG_11203 [Loa loa]|uniref:Uncharacterized protein n=1 Tax=Loa loa TaxID=7209 RepID=A0A1S0TPW4_LOALO|nr:hypothetical protein LOAG_11203 [Loa loa]EFO17292.1 hypothetical protein LOAG_11203 [Loa loa]